jgi:hypothetical protein
VGLLIFVGAIVLWQLHVKAGVSDGRRPTVHSSPPEAIGAGLHAKFGLATQCSGRATCAADPGVRHKVQI